MKITLSASFSRTIQITDFNPENTWTSTSVEIECQDGDNNWIEKTNQLREEIFRECKSFVGKKIRERLKELEEQKNKNSEKQMFTDFTKVQKDARIKRGKMSVEEQNTKK